MEITTSKLDWPELSSDNIIRINTLTNIQYQGDDKYWKSWYNAWWIKDKSDPWSPTSDWVNNYIEPNNEFKSCTNDKLRWKCGYSYNIKLPQNFKKNKKYPLLIFLHGGVREYPRSLTWKIKGLENFHVSESDPYIIAAPFKLGIDWSPKRILDMLEDIKSNAKFAEQLEDDCNNLMAEVTKKDKKFWKENQRSDYFLSAEEALELGIIDKIV